MQYHTVSFARELAAFVHTCECRGGRASRDVTYSAITFPVISNAGLVLTSHLNSI